MAHWKVVNYKLILQQEKGWNFIGIDGVLSKGELPYIRIQSIVELFHWDEGSTK